MSDFINSWDNAVRAESYARLEFPGTYYLAYRDLPEIIRTHVKGTRALDFGCGTGRSSRFLKNLGFSVTGIDIASDMLKKAQESDPEGEYLLVEDGVYEPLRNVEFDFIQAIFTFDNIPGMDRRIYILSELRSLLKKDGVMLLLDSTPDIYTHEWASFTTRQFATNFTARCGDKVYTVMNDVDDKTPVEDFFFTDEDYHTTFASAGLEVVKTYRPLGLVSEPYRWISEITVAPWVIYVVQPA